MGALESQIKMMDMLAASEEAISRLYAVYADKFSEHRDFWAGLSVEELDHARWIREVEDKMKDEISYFDWTRISGDSIETFIDYVDGQAAKAKAKPVLASEAFFIANDIENSMIENKWFEACKGDSLTFQRLVFDLGQATARHREQLSKFSNMSKKGDS